MKKSFILVLLLLGFCLAPAALFAVERDDTDGDGISNADETGIYKTDSAKADTDGDGFSDREELIKGFSPHNPEKIKLEKNDFDKDGLSDRMEFNFHTDLSKADTDGDGFRDGEEIKTGFDPLNKDPKARLGKKIEINAGKEQTLYYYLGGVRLGQFRVSTGKPGMPTPKGNFTIKNKSPKAWSKTYKLWMPYWLGMGNFGIHELPVWPNGYREGAGHIGKPVSHGCIRLPIGDAKILYDWAEVGTKVYIF
ncbi:MAG: L,D-transpeptidase family protein [Patescibacteria group bacterium]|jgi:hypothetical protein